MKKSILMFLFALLFFSSAVDATPIEWSTESGGNGNYYQFVDHGEYLSWQTAKALAENMTFQGFSGHLATVTSNIENTFVSSSSVWSDTSVSVWLGAEYHGEWTWVTGEEWNYTNWNAGSPNNLSSPGGDYLLYFERHSRGKWGDAYTSYFEMTGFIVEYGIASAPVPEPGTMILFGMGCLGFARVLRKKRH
ncbi:MAG: lectin-like protein [Desulfobacter sp.]